jgi:hypothetical protein
MLTEEEFREQLHRRAGPRLDAVQAPAGWLEGIRARQARRTRVLRSTSVVAAVAGVAAVVAAGSMLFGGHRSASPAAPLPSPTPGTALIASGPCAGLSVTGSRGEGAPGEVHVRPGTAGNLVHLGGGQFFTLRAVGPCVARLRYQTHTPFLQGPGPDKTLWSFQQGAGLVVTNRNPFAATATVDLLLTGGTKTPTKLATLTFLVAATQPAVVSVPTAQANPSVAAASAAVAVNPSAAVPSLPATGNKVPLIGWPQRGSLVTTSFAADAEVAWDNALGPHHDITVVYAGSSGQYAGAVLEGFDQTGSPRLAILLRATPGAPVTVVQDRPTPQGGGLRELSALARPALANGQPATSQIAFAIVHPGDTVEVRCSLLTSQPGPLTYVTFTPLPLAADRGNTALRVPGANATVTVPIDKG